MKVNIDFLFVPKADINEGLTSGTVSKSAIYFTKEYFFVIPFGSLHIWDNSKMDFNNAKEFIEDINSRADSISVEEFQNNCVDFLPNERVYKVDALEKFSIQVGFLIFGGMRMKKPGEQVQAANIQPKSLRAEIKKFYGL
ncbi:MAG: hypothetical protein K8R54_04230 [Bacteroidales bacterium]|nr:hypothetical protein [Bacteroidales bacterium]